MRKRIVVEVMIAALGLPAVAGAAPVLWTLAGVVFDDGGAAAGSFLYDADANVFSEVDISTTDGATLGGAFYQFVHPLFPPDPIRILVVETLPLAIGVHGMNLTFDTPLTNAGGIVPLGKDVFGAVTGIEGLCTSAGCFGVDPFRHPIAGQVRGTPVEAPEPVLLLLLTPGLAFIGRRQVRRRR